MPRLLPDDFNSEMTPDILGDSTKTLEKTLENGRAFSVPSGGPIKAEPKSDGLHPRSIRNLAMASNLTGMASSLVAMV